MSAPFFDVNILADWLRGYAPAAAELARYPQHQISRICWTQIVAQEPLETRRNIHDLLMPFQISELDARIADAAADIHHRTRIDLDNAIILASAQVNGSILVTRNIKDFPAEMPGIRIPYTLEEKA